MFEASVALDAIRRGGRGTAGHWGWRDLGYPPTRSSRSAEEQTGLWAAGQGQGHVAVGLGLGSGVLLPADGVPSAVGEANTSHLDRHAKAWRVCVERGLRGQSGSEGEGRRVRWPREPPRWRALGPRARGAAESHGVTGRAASPRTLRVRGRPEGRRLRREVDMLCHQDWKLSVFPADLTGCGQF